MFAAPPHRCELLSPQTLLTSSSVSPLFPREIFVFFLLTRRSGGESQQILQSASLGLRSPVHVWKQLLGGLRYYHGCYGRCQLDVANAIFFPQKVLDFPLTDFKLTFKQILGSANKHRIAGGIHCRTMRLWKPLIICIFTEEKKQDGKKMVYHFCQEELAEKSERGGRFSGLVYNCCSPLSHLFLVLQRGLMCSGMDDTVLPK